MANITAVYHKRNIYPLFWFHMQALLLKMLFSIVILFYHSTVIQSFIDLFIYSINISLFSYLHECHLLLPCLFKSALLLVLNLAKKPCVDCETVDFNYMHLWCNYYISMSIHVRFYCEQCAVTLIQRVQHSKNRLCRNDLCTAADATLLEHTAGPQQCTVWRL